MDEKATPQYACDQMMKLLSSLDLADKHEQKVKMIKMFQDYITDHRPEIYDDDVRKFFLGGSWEGEELRGILVWCGQKSSKHGEGALKRSAQNAIGLVKWLIDFNFMRELGRKRYEDEEEEVNLFLTQFIALPVAAYGAMELELHVKSGVGSSGGGGLFSKKVDTSRSGSQATAFELIALLLRGHNDEDSDGDAQPLDLAALLPSPGSRLAFSTWLQETAVDEERRGALAAAATSSSSSSSTSVSSSSSSSSAIAAVPSAGARPGGAAATGGGGAAAPGACAGGAAPTWGYRGRAAPVNRAALSQGELADYRRQLRKEAPQKWADAKPLHEPSAVPGGGGVAVAAVQRGGKQQQTAAARSIAKEDDGSTDEDIVDDPDWETDGVAADGGNVAASVASAAAAAAAGSESGSLFEALGDGVGERSRGSIFSGSIVGGGGGRGVGGGGSTELAADPLGLSEMNLQAVEVARLRSSERSLRSGGLGGDGGASGGGDGARGRRGSLLGFAAKQKILESLTSAAPGGDLAAAGGDGAGDGSGGGRGGGAGTGSVLPTSSDFDPVAFLTLVHGSASVADLVRGRVHLEKQVGRTREGILVVGCYFFGEEEAAAD